MTEEKNLLHEIGDLATALKPKKTKRIKVNYWLIVLIVMGIFLVVQTVQLSLIKAKISQGSFNVGAAAASVGSGSSLPDMAGGC